MLQPTGLPLQALASLTASQELFPTEVNTQQQTGDVENGLPVMDRSGATAKDETAFPSFRLRCLLPDQLSRTEMFQVYGIPDRQVVRLFPSTFISSNI